MRVWAKKVNFWLVLCSVISTIFFALSLIHFGAGLSNDSIAYWAAAKSFYQNGTFYLPYREAYFTAWPPLFSILLSSGYFFGIDNLLSYYSFWLAVIHFLTVYFVGRLAYNLTGTLLFAVLALILFAISGATYVVFSYLLTESVFILFTIMFLASLIRYSVQGTRQLLLFCAVMAALSFMTRYAGIVNIAVGAIFILLYPRKNLPQRLSHVFVFGFISCIMLVTWCLRNYYISSTVTGAGRTVLLTNPIYMFVLLVKAGWEWLLPYPDHPYAGIITIIFGLPVVLFLLYVGLYRLRKHNFSEKVISLQVFSLFTIVYLFFIWVTASLQSSDAPNIRMNAPAYFSFVLVLTVVLHDVYLKKGYILMKGILGGVVLVIIFYNAYGYAHFLQTALAEGIRGHSSKQSRCSHIIAVLREDDVLQRHAQAKEVFTNNPEMVYYYHISSIYKIHKGFREEAFSVAFKTKTENKIIVWLGHVERLQSFLENNMQDYTLKEKRVLQDGYILYFKLKK